MDRASNRLRLLSFDGGHIRGLAGLLVVLELMQRLMFDLELRKPPRPCEYFEMTIGSGTGGLNAILLGRLGFSAEDAIYQYIRIAKVAFQDNQIESEQRVQSLRKVLESVLKDAGLEPDAKMEGTDTVVGHCRTSVCVAAAEDIIGIRLLRSYRGRVFHSPSCTIIDAIFATLASPGSFEPIKIEGIGPSEGFIDGDINCSNPAIELLREAADVFGPHIELSALVSLGSGRENTAINSVEGKRDTAARNLVTIETQKTIACERIHEDLQRRTRNLNVYFRFNPGWDINSSQTQEWKQLSFLKTKTMSYLQMEMVSQQLDAVVEALYSNRNGILLSEINMSSRIDVRNKVPTSIRSQFEENFDSHILTQQKTASAQGTMHERCLQGTRGSILERIRQWAAAGQTSKPIFWLCDSAGTGKSTIAVTMGKEWTDSNWLASQFCFSNSSADTSSTSLFFPTVAVDVASRIPELRSLIASVFKKDPMLVKRGLAEQFTKLILEPLKTISRDIILIIDAADECEAGSRNNLLKLLVQQLPLVPHLKIFITSRPEHDIFPILEDSSIVHTIEFQLQTTEITSNVDDISIYINYHLSGLLSERQCQMLINRANGLFIWASTAKRELDTNAAFESTEDIFARLMSSGDSKDLGLLYHGILERVVPNPEHVSFVCRVLGVILTIQEPLSIESLEMFIPGKPVEKLMQRLRSVFSFKRRDDPILFFHPTFREYLLGAKRNAFMIDIISSHLLVASQCFRFMQKELKLDICGTGYSIGHLPNNKDILDPLVRLKSCVTIPLLYSVKYWFVHVGYCVGHEEIIERTLSFFHDNLLHWVEVLSLSNQIVVGIKGLYELKKRIEALSPEPSLNRMAQVENWCNDTIKLIQTQQAVLEINAFSIYSIVILSAPREGILYNGYEQRSWKNAPKMLKGWRNRWPSHIVLHGHKSAIGSLSVSNDGTRIASGSYDNTLQIWDTATGASECNPIHYSSAITAVAFSLTDSHLIFGSSEGELVVRRLATIETPGSILQGHTDSINQLAFSSDGTRLVSASKDSTLRLWNMSDASLAPVVIEGHTYPINSVSFSRDGGMFASGSDDKTVMLWNGTTGTSLGGPLEGHHRSVTYVAFSPTGAEIASASADTTLRLWSVERRVCIGGPFYGHSEWVRCLSFSPDGRKIASGSDDNTIRIWDVATQECIYQLRGHTNWVRGVAFLPEGNRIVSASHDSTIRIWDLDAQQGGEEETREDHTGYVFGIAFSPCGSRVATCSQDRTSKLWSALTGELLGEMKGHTMDVNCLAFSSDGSRIASGSDDQTVRLWDVETVECCKVLQGHAGVNCLVFSHEGSRIISGNSDGTLQLCDSITGTAIGKKFEPHPSPINCTAFSPDDNSIVSGCKSGLIQLWNGTGSKLHAYSHKSEIIFAIFSTDGLHILSACEQEIKVWSVSSSDNIARFPHFHSSTSNTLPRHIQDLKFDINATSDGFSQSSTVLDSIRRYFSNNHLIQACFDKNTRTINLSKSSNYSFHIPASILALNWRGRDGIIVLTGYEGQITILDFSHLSL